MHLQGLLRPETEKETVVDVGRRGRRLGGVRGRGPFVGKHSNNKQVLPRTFLVVGMSKNEKEPKNKDEKEQKNDKEIPMLKDEKEPKEEPKNDKMDNNEGELRAAESFTLEFEEAEIWSDNSSCTDICTNYCVSTNYGGVYG